MKKLMVASVSLLLTNVAYADVWKGTLYKDSGWSQDNQHGALVASQPRKVPLNVSLSWKGRKRNKPFVEGYRCRYPFRLSPKNGGKFWGAICFATWVEGSCNREEKLILSMSSANPTVLWDLFDCDREKLDGSQYLKVIYAGYIQWWQTEKGPRLR